MRCCLYVTNDGKSQPPPFSVIHITNYIFFHYTFFLLTILFTFLVTTCNRELKYRNFWYCLLVLLISLLYFSHYYLLITKFINVKLHSFNFSFRPLICPPCLYYFDICPCVPTWSHIWLHSYVCVFSVVVYIISCSVTIYASPENKKRGRFPHNNNNHGSTALYGSGPPLSEVTWSAHLWQFGDQPTGRAVQLNPDVTTRAIWQAVRRLG
jgi:hypothetical protein